MVGKHLRQIAGLHIRTHGEPVTVYRRAATAGGAPTSAVYACLPQPLSARQSAALRAEGALNLGEENPYLFVFEAGAEVNEATDWIVWNSFRWRVLNTNPTREQGVTVSQSAYAVREGPA